MDEYQKQKDKIEKLFADSSSTEDSVHDFSDDGAYGSDADYNPRKEDTGTSDTSSSSNHTRTRYSRSREISDSDSSTSSESVNQSALTLVTRADVHSTRAALSSSDSQQSPVQHNALPGSSSSPTSPILDSISVATSANIEIVDVPQRPQSPSLLDAITQENTPEVASNVPPLQNQNNNDESWTATIRDIPEFDFNSSGAGPKITLNDNTTPYDLFRQVFPDDLLEYVVTCTNAYGKALLEKRRTTRRRRPLTFKDTDITEMRKFLGLCMLQGQMSISKRRNIFTRTNALYYHPVFGFSMSCRRFEQLLRCLSVAELNAVGEDKIDKFIDQITLNFRKVFSPGRELSLDESLLLFRGRLYFRQYIKSKKARYGIKFYVLTTADGYVLNIIMSKGKKNSTAEAGKKTEKLVLRLMRPYLLKGHHLFMDNFYNSIELSEILLDLKTHTNGTLRTNRKGLPKNVVDAKLKKGQHIWLRKNRVYISKWQDKRPVTMITTINHPKIIEVSNRYGQKKLKPEEISLYNTYMSGIDRADQMVSYYSSPRKTLFWYKKVFFHLLDIAVWNSYYIYKNHCKKSNNYQFITYREELINAFLQLDPKLDPAHMTIPHKNDNRCKRNRSAPNPTNSSQDGTSSSNTGGQQGHWPEMIPIRSESTKKSYFKKCRECTKNGIRRETRVQCKGCDDKPPLCAPCFEDWHKRK